MHYKMTMFCLKITCWGNLLFILNFQSGEVKGYPGSFVCVIQSLAGVHPSCLLLQLLYDQSGGVDLQLDAAQAAGLGLNLGALSIIVRHRDIVVGSWFGEAPDINGRHNRAAVQGNRAS
ncbi:hypothetical protein ILYODFUR_013286 [Ilyodon furcidens]|uniref:Uncharacterized protein n=1 Tax=Ilyodon furcidens TaxID=33524 RepID=A0ABV0U6Y5_9TELE